MLHSNFLVFREQQRSCLPSIPSSPFFFVKNSVEHDVAGSVQNLGHGETMIQESYLYDAKEKQRKGNVTMEAMRPGHNNTLEINVIHVKILKC